MKTEKTNFITLLLFAINVIVFVYMSFTGDTQDTGYLYKMGAMYVPDLIEKGEYYRIFTHMFLHSGITHIVNNMVMLLAVGFTLEERIGHIKFLIVYILGGVAASVFSGAYEIITGNFSVGVGASGAIMAVFGTLIMTTLKDRKNRGNNEVRRLLIVLVIVIFGNIGPGIDWMAHLGGALAGLLTGAVFYKKKRR